LQAIATGADVYPPLVQTLPQEFGIEDIGQAQGAQFTEQELIAVF